MNTIQKNEAVKDDKWFRFFAYAAELAINQSVTAEEIKMFLGYETEKISVPRLGKEFIVLADPSKFSSDFVENFKRIFGFDPLME